MYNAHCPILQGGLLMEGLFDTINIVSVVLFCIGMVLILIEMFIPGAFTSAGMTDENIAVVFADCVGVPHTDNNEDMEDIEIITMSWDEMAQVVLNNKEGYVMGMRTALLLAFIHARPTFWKGTENPHLNVGYDW